MEEVVDLDDGFLCPSSQVPQERDCGFASGFMDSQSQLPSAPVGSTGGGRSRGKKGASMSLQGASQSQTTPGHKLRGPNWTEAEMLVLIGQKRIEWDSRHNCSQPSLAKFVYGTTAWKLVLAGCMAVVGFRLRDADQLTNKWDGLIKDYKKLKVYLEGTGSGNWWGMNREEKRELCKTRRLCHKHWQVPKLPQTLALRGKKNHGTTLEHIQHPAGVHRGCARHAAQQPWRQHKRKGEEPVKPKGRQG